MFRYVNIFKQLNRTLTSKPVDPKLELLNERTILKIVGNEVTDYLQGLITNDIKHLSEGASCMYSMFLNTKGRILYDTIIYNTFNDDTFLIECDTKAAESLQKHLKIYKLRKKIDIIDLKDEYSLYVIFSPESLNVKDAYNLFSKKMDGIVFSNNFSNNARMDPKGIKMIKDMYIYRDPRMHLLGYRLIAPKDKDVKQELLPITAVANVTGNETYKWFRYSLGIGEGINDLPPENSFPLEANCDYLHGVSFHKGCYIGQELTARTYHTGIVRKRLMPLKFSKLPTTMPETPVISNNINLGKLRGIEHDAGLALLRITQSLSQKDIQLGDGIARTEKPMWWPIEAPKEKINAQRSE